MRVIYVDESVSERAPATVIAAVIVDMDAQYRRIIGEMDELRARVGAPSDLIFHAADIMNRSLAPFHLPEWDDADKRMGVVRNLIAIPGRAGAVISITWFPNDTGGTAELNLKRTKNGKKKSFAMNPKDFGHYAAFGVNIFNCEKYIKDCLDDSLASVVAESHSRMEPLLLELPDLLKSNFFKENIEKPEFQILMLALGPITNIVHDIQFHRKENAPILQIADSIAYGVQSFKSGYPSGMEYLRVLYGGGEPEIEGFSGLTGGVVFDAERR